MVDHTLNGIIDSCLHCGRPHTYWHHWLMSALWSTTQCTGIIDSCLRYGRPHTAHQIAKISKVKDFALILLIGVFSISSLYLLSNNHLLSNRFTTLSYSVCQSQLFNESSKSRCCNKEHLIKMQIILRCVNSAFRRLIVWYFYLNSLTFVVAVKKINWFLCSGHSV